MNKSKNIFIGVQEIAGFATGLHDGLNKLNIKNDIFLIKENLFKYDLEVNNLTQQLLLVRNNISKSKFLKSKFYSFYYYVLLIYFFIHALKHYNVFVFIGRTTIFSKMQDLPIMRLLGKKIIFIFLGTEIRPSYMSGNLILKYVENNKSFEGIEQLWNSTIEKKNAIRKIEKNCNIIISHPSYSQLLFKNYIKLFSFGYPIKRNNIISDSTALNNYDFRKINILHAPTNPGAKGTYKIRKTIEKLKKEGLIINYREIINRPNHEVIEAIKNSDLIIDQINSDSPLGGLGIEGAIYGVPTLTGGYYIENLYKDYYKDDCPPSFYCLPEDLEEELRKIIIKPIQLKNKGQIAQTFIENKWNTKQVATNLIRIINNEVPSDWYYNNLQNEYFLGSNLLKDKFIKIYKEYYKRFGDEGFLIKSEVPAFKKIKTFIDA